MFSYLAIWAMKQKSYIVPATKTAVQNNEIQFEASDITLMGEGVMVDGLC